MRKGSSGCLYIFAEFRPNLQMLFGRENRARTHTHTHTHQGSRATTRLLRRALETALQKVLSRALSLRRCVAVGFRGKKGSLSGPISRDIAILSLRYPLSRDTFSANPAIPQQGAIPPLGAFFYTDISVRYPILQHIARYLCDTPGKQARKSFAILSLKVSRDMKSIAAGPLRGF